MEQCLICKICCRFPDRHSPLIPFFLGKERGTYYGCRIDVIKYGSGYICPYFIPEKNCCSIYNTRPLDCRLYPFMITYDDTYKKVILVLDNNCPYGEEFIRPDEVDIIEQDIGFINDYQPDSIFVEELPKLTEFVFGKSGRFRKLRLEDKHIVPYLWKDIMNVLYDEETQEVYYNFKRFSNNNNKDYIYFRKDLVELKGDRYRDKRNLCNYFQKNYTYTIEKLSPTDEPSPCTQGLGEHLNLYRKWAEGKKDTDKYTQQLIEDSFFFHRRAFLDFDRLGLEGIEIRVDNKIVGYTFGFRASSNTFYILGEITDRDYKGINQFIFREFSRRISEDCIYINTMDDSGISGLRSNKMSYRPVITT